MFCEVCKGVCPSLWKLQPPGSRAGPEVEKTHLGGSGHLWPLVLPPSPPPPTATPGIPGRHADALAPDKVRTNPYLVLTF